MDADQLIEWYLTAPVTTRPFQQFSTISEVAAVRA
jgi:hypothetical protein